VRSLRKRKVASSILAGGSPFFPQGISPIDWLDFTYHIVNRQLTTHINLPIVNGALYGGLVKHRLVMKTNLKLIHILAHLDITRMYIIFFSGLKSKVVFQFYRQTFEIQSGYLSILSSNICSRQKWDKNSYFTPFRHIFLFGQITVLYIIF
jgi:hypothetical protein